MTSPHEQALAAEWELHSFHSVSEAGYRVTRDGRIFSGSGWRGHTERELSQSLNANGYPSVRIVVGGKRRHLAVHRLVALCFLGPRPSPEYEVRHLDGDRTNNFVENLAWGTRSENALDRQRHGTEKGPENAARTIASRTGELCATAKLSNADAAAIRSRVGGGESIDRVAADYPHVHRDTVKNAARGKTFRASSLAAELAEIKKEAGR